MNCSKNLGKKIFTNIFFSQLQLDSKKSPLALLAQTCSQIGADSNNVKSIISPIDGKTSNGNKKTDLTASTMSRSPSAIGTTTATSTASSNATITATTGHGKMDKFNSTSSAATATTTPEIKLAFKPYEMNVLTKSERPSSKSSSVSVENNNLSDDNSRSMNRKDIRVSSRNSTESPSKLNNNNSSVKNHNYSENGKSSPHGSDRKSASPNETSSQRGASPIIRSGLEILHGHPKDMPLGTYKGYSINPLTGLCCPPGMEQHTNPAFRPPYAGYSHHHHAAMLAAAGYQTSAASSNPYLSYARVKTPSGGEALVPVCKDPYCTGCQFSAHSHQMMMGACPAGCQQCEHQKYGLAMAAMSGLPAGHPYAAAAAAAAAQQQQQQQMNNRPYTCNWIVGDSYCGKRFNASDELFQHLRTHTPNLSDPATAAAVLAAQQSSLLNPLGNLFSQSPLHRGYSNPQLSPLSAAAAAARYHPYAKPGSMQQQMASSQYSAFNPALGAYYNPYAIYNQRLGAAAVHP